MAGTKIAVVAFLLLTLLASSSVPAVTAFHCMDDCIERCSNGKNLDSCKAMCKTACVPAGAAAEIAKEVDKMTGGKA